MIIEEEDDWDPNPNDIILKKIHINFTNKVIDQNIKQMEQDEENLMNQTEEMKKDINDFTKKADKNEQEDEEHDNKIFEEKIKNIKNQILEENFYDPLQDENDEEWISKNLIESNKDSNIVLSCPYCFIQVCYDSQRHSIYKTQYRAMFVKNCKVNCDKMMQPLNKKQNKNQQEQQQDHEIYFSLECDQCSTEIGVFEFDQKIYHFFDVIPGLG